MEDQQPFTPGSPIYQESKERNAKWLWVLIILIIIGALGFAFWKGIGPFAAIRGSKAQVSPTPSAMTEVTSPSPEASTSSQVDKSKAKIRVLNGNGTVGVATTMKDFLTTKGWTVSATGNAANYNFTQTVIKLKDSFKSYADALTRDLNDKYSVTTSSSSLEASDSADIEVTVGAK